MTDRLAQDGFEPGLPLLVLHPLLNLLRYPEHPESRLLRPAYSGFVDPPFIGIDFEPIVAPARDNASMSDQQQAFP
jgi:hypothetical protein